MRSSSIAPFEVARMFDIYDRASQIICYVGEHSDETDTALDFVKPIDQLKIEMNEKVVFGNRTSVAFGSLDAAAYNMQAMISLNLVLRTQMMRADPQLYQFGLSYDELILSVKLSTLGI
ncbi:hypothetical protein K4K58_001467 [Colletotrichum sp. SAR11_239]|nr:hypothetical protein K4K58_001467 [Colletotrichum sp. SAR11_239]